MLTDREGSEPPPEIYSSWPLEQQERMHEKHLGAPKSTSRARAIRLDDYLEKAGVAKVDLVKIDVDGFECHVFGGAARLLAGKPVLVMEPAPYVLVERGRSLEKLLGILSKAGYALESERTGNPLPQDAAALQALIPDGSSMNVVAR